MQYMARKLVSNEQGGLLAALQVSAGQTPSQQSLGALVVHAVAVLYSRGSVDLIRPLTTLLTNPANMAVSSIYNSSSFAQYFISKSISVFSKEFYCKTIVVYKAGEF